LELRLAFAAALGVEFSLLNLFQKLGVEAR
jgi:hypothetical protein